MARTRVPELIAEALAADARRRGRGGCAAAERLAEARWRTTNAGGIAS